MRTEMEGERRGVRRWWVEDRWIDFSFSLLPSKSERPKMVRESKRIEEVAPMKAPRPPPPCWIAFCLFAFRHQQTLCSKLPGRPALLPMSLPKANQIFLLFCQHHPDTFFPHNQVNQVSVFSQTGQEGTMPIDIGPKERQK